MGKRVTGNGYRVSGFLRTPDPESRIPINNSGMALIIIVAIIAILSAIGITFMYTMRMEEKAAFNYVNSLKASYIAKSGIEHAIAVLKSDGGDTGYDAYTEKWGYDTDLNGSVFSAYSNNNNDSVDNDSFLGTFSPNCDAGLDSRWLYVVDDNGDTVGRYAVLIIDESSKININTAGNVPANQGWKPFEISLKDFFEAGQTQLGWTLGDVPQNLANQVVWDRSFYSGARYGLDGGIPIPKPGVPNSDDNADSIILEYDGIDNDADWDIATMDYNGDGRPDHGEYSGNAGCDEPGEGVDDPYEFVAWKPYYDSSGGNSDTPFIIIEEIAGTGILVPEGVDAVKPYITVYSSDENTTDSGFLRLNINLVKDAMALYTIMYDAWEDLIPTYSYDEIRHLAAQCAVNTIDYADRDNVTTFLEVSADGTDTTIARGVEGIRINEVMVKPAYQWEAEELFASWNPVGEVAPNKLGATDWYLDPVVGDTFIYSKTPDAEISANIEVKRKGYYRLRVLSYDDCTYSVTGQHPTNVSPTSLEDTNQDWTGIDWTGATITIVSGTGAGQTQWITGNSPDTVNVSGWDAIKGQPDPTSIYEIEKDNSFRIRIYDGMDIILEDTVGEHNIGGWLLEDDLGILNVEESSHQYGIELTTSSILNSDTGARLGYIQLSQQPDCEYVELVNISNRDIDISNWTLTTSAGFAGTIPASPTPTIITANGGYMVLVGDRDDRWKFMKDPDVEQGVVFGTGADDIAFKNTWPGVDLENVRALELSTSPINIAENVFGDTIVLTGSIFEDSPLAAPKPSDDYGTADGGSSNTLTDGSKTWDVNKWAGATITAIGQTRWIDSNTETEVTISSNWDPILTIPCDYYIHFEPMAITLWEGLRADGKIVAQVDYRAEDVNETCYIQFEGTPEESPVYGFVALEKNDPTVISDWDEDGIDDSWLLNDIVSGIGGDSQVPGIRGGTPGSINSVATKNPADIDPKKTMRVRNLPFATIGDIKDVSTSDTNFEWAKIGYESDGTTDYVEFIKRLADKITVSDKRLDAENSTYYYTILGLWTDYSSDDTFLTPYYSTSSNTDTGIWEWGLDQRINPDTGIYDLYISGKVLKANFDSSDTMLVKVTTWYDGGKDYGTKALSFSEDNIAYYGQIAMQSKDGSDTYLQLEIWKEVATTDNTISFDAAILTPEYRTYGVININTADTPVLQALPGITDVIANDIVAYRKGPKGPFHTIGEILTPDIPDMTVDLFSKISNLITTKSKIFTIISTGQALRESDKGTVNHAGKTYEILGEKKYIVVMER